MTDVAFAGGLRLLRGPARPIGLREANRQAIAQGMPVQAAYLLRLKLVCFFILHARLWVRQST